MSKGDSKLLNKVRASCSKLNPIVSNNSIAKRVKAIRKNLLEISTDMALFGFVSCDKEEQVLTGIRRGQDPGSFVDSKEVIGREEDKKFILEILLNESDSVELDVPIVIAIVGIGGMGKTTLAQLIYNDDVVENNFEKRWFASISDTSDEKEILGKIYQSICDESYSSYTISLLQAKIRESVQGKQFLLVLDDVWDEDHCSWIDRLSLLKDGAKGSKVIVTTRSLSVARAMGSLKTHKLDGLSEEDSWNLFKRFAFSLEQENNPRWVDLGKQILKKCANVPLAIRSIGGLLYTKTTIQEWESFRNEEIQKLGQSGKDPTMSVLKLSYDHLPSYLKQCFAYCSLFPKGCIIDQHELIYLWIAQGYIEPPNETQTLEEVGYSYFMYLSRRSFFSSEHYRNRKMRYKMHDLIHDLAQHVAGKESFILTGPSSKIIKGTRHASVEYATDDSWAIPEPLLNVSQLRSFLLMGGGSISRQVHDQQFGNINLLRALSLRKLDIEHLSGSIGELKHLRYLDLSETMLKYLPDSITKLVNLQRLNLHGCYKLEALPIDFRKLINLRRLDTRYCARLNLMPPGFGELVSLRYLDEFKVSRGICGGQSSKLDSLQGLELIRNLWIKFVDDTDGWNGAEYWYPLVSLEALHISSYKGASIPQWGPSLLPKLTRLTLVHCLRVKCLPHFRHLPNLRYLVLEEMWDLEYIEEDMEDPVLAAGLSVSYLCHLEQLELLHLYNLKGWSRKVEAATRSKAIGALPQLLYLTCLSILRIRYCKEFKSMPLCPCLRTVELVSSNVEVLEQFFSICDDSSTSCLEHVSIFECHELSTFPGGYLTSLRALKLYDCRGLNHVELPASDCNMIGYLSLWNIDKLELWEESKRGVDWDSLSNLRKLSLSEIPSSEMLPDCLRCLQALGKLRISHYFGDD